jgi:hypothetical protein
LPRLLHLKLQCTEAETRNKEQVPWRVLLEYDWASFLGLRFVFFVLLSSSSEDAVSFHNSVC